MSRLSEFLSRQLFGYKADLARAMGRSPGYLSRQLAGERAFTERDCIEIEKFTEGQVRCEDILDDVDWAYLRNSAMRASRGRKQPATAAR